MESLNDAAGAVKLDISVLGFYCGKGEVKKNVDDCVNRGVRLFPDIGVQFSVKIMLGSCLLLAGIGCNW